MLKVEVKDGNVEGALKKLKIKVQRNGIPSEIKKRKNYVKPGVKKRLAKIEGIKNSRKKNRY